MVELIARKIECLRVEQPRLKMMTWENMKELVNEKVNCLLSDKQLTYVLKCLTNAGVVSLPLLFYAGVLYFYFYFIVGLSGSRSTCAIYFH